MHTNKRNKLETRGWKIGDADDFLELTPEESAYIEIKLALSRFLKERRLNSNFSQARLAKLIKSSQSRIAKMESGNPSVSIDLLMKSLLALGASADEVAEVIALRNSR